MLCLELCLFQRHISATAQPTSESLSLSPYLMEQNGTMCFGSKMSESHIDRSNSVIVFIEQECVESDFGWETPIGVSLDSSVLCQRQDGAQTHLFNRHSN